MNYEIALNEYLEAYKTRLIIETESLVWNNHDKQYLEGLRIDEQQKKDKMMALLHASLRRELEEELTPLEEAQIIKKKLKESKNAWRQAARFMYEACIQPNEQGIAPKDMMPKADWQAILGLIDKGVVADEKLP